MYSYCTRSTSVTDSIVPSPMQIRLCLLRPWSKLSLFFMRLRAIFTWEQDQRENFHSVRKKNPQSTCHIVEDWGAREKWVLKRASSGDCKGCHLKKCPLGTNAQYLGVPFCQMLFGNLIGFRLSISADSMSPHQNDGVCIKEGKRKFCSIESGQHWPWLTLQKNRREVETWQGRQTVCVLL